MHKININNAEFYCSVASDKDKKSPLREGFTTGTAASAAAAAATYMLLTNGVIPAFISVPLPPFEDHSEVKRLKVNIENHGSANCATVIKDGGDDPDATHGMHLVACAAFSSDELPSFSHPATTDNSPPTPIALEYDITLFTGRGIGLVTLPGLPVKVGEPAVNPSPRAQIAMAVHEIALQFHCDAPIYIFLETEDGEKRAKNTLNSRLGILGGISILGTSGIVRPYSHDAWTAVIAQSISQAASLGSTDFAFSTGRRGERAMQRELPALPEQAFIQAADYAEFSIKQAINGKAKHIYWGCFAGKLLKLAQGLGWTHASGTSVDLAMLHNICIDSGVSDELAGILSKSPTVQGALDMLEVESTEIALEVAKKIALKAYSTLRSWMPEENSHTLELLVFKTDGKLWFKLNDATE